MQFVFMLRYICPECFTYVNVNARGKIESHERSYCAGSHMEWKGCKSGDKTHPNFQAASGMSDMITWMAALIEMAEEIRNSCK